MNRHIQQVIRCGTTALLLCSAKPAMADGTAERGRWFAKKAYSPVPIPTFAES